MSLSKVRGRNARSDADTHGARVLPVERWLVGRLFHLLGLSHVRVVLWDDRPAVDGKPDGPAMHIHDRGAMYRLFKNPHVGFGDGYSSGRIDVLGDLRDFLESVYRGLYRARNNFVPRLIARLNAGPRLNTLAGSRDNIHSHYDLGNDFYKLWLDEQMVYTCAYYPTKQATLEEAQVAKMDHVCRKLRLEPGMQVVEAGCGWGALAIHMAQHYGVNVKAYNIAHQQVSYAKLRAQQLGIADRAQFIEDDYRNIDGSFDRFVSVGMLEHVGVDNYATLGRVIDRCLTADGAGLIHTIGRNTPRPMDKWIEKRIFPGANPPSLKQMMDIFEVSHLSVLDVENIRLHYARTCADWLERFEKHSDQVAEMFDAFFVRAWRLYLTGSVAAFATGGLQLFQVVFNRQLSNDVPLTREHLYEQREETRYARV